MDRITLNSKFVIECVKIKRSLLAKYKNKVLQLKKGHQGYGLANIRKLEEKYPDMSVSYMVQDGWFDFYMVIDMEDGDEDNG